jgi:hypothetical protein
MSLDHWIEVIKTREPNITPERLLKHIEIFTKDEADFIEEMDKKFQERKDSTRISCFSKIYDSLLMWSHYSDKHKGACIEFSKDKLTKSFTMDFQVCDVNYSSFIESKNISVFREEAIRHWISSKAKEWHYEEEIRFILGSDPDEFQKIPMNSIQRIFLGCKTTKEEKELIEALVFDELKYHWIEIYDMEISTIEYKLKNNKRY